MRIALLACFILLIGGCTARPDIQADNTQELKVAAERPKAYLPKLQGKRVGLVVNQTSKVGGSHLVDYLLDKSINVARIFAPEHGFRGDHDAGAHVNSEIDAATGIPITSIYGKFKKPPVEMLQQLDVVVFDIQDVGVRFYTYISLWCLIGQTLTGASLMGQSLSLSFAHSWVCTPFLFYTG